MEQRESFRSGGRSIAAVVCLALMGCGSTTNGSPGSPASSGGSGGSTADGGGGDANARGGATSGGGTVSGGATGRGGTNANGGASSGGAPSPDAGEGKTLCDDYCDTIMSACTRRSLQYKTPDVCRSVCHTLPEGSVGDTTGNTANCRLSAAKRAASTADPTECQAAGPAGNGVCGTPCDGLCALAPVARPSGTLGSSNCEAICATLPDVGSYNNTMQGGYDVQCRIYHVTLAIADPQIHCTHVDGIVGPCAPPP